MGIRQGRYYGVQEKSQVLNHEKKVLLHFSGFGGVVI